MAKQSGLMKLRGTIDGIVFYQSEGGFLAKRASTLNKQRIVTDESFQRTRENMAEFNYASKSGKLLRDAVRPMLKNMGDSKAVSRMLKLMSEVKKFDSTSVRGERNVGIAIANANAKALLKGYQFNRKAPLHTVLVKPHALNTSTGVVTITGLIPKNDLSAPPTASHVSIKSVWARIDFASGLLETFESNVVNLPLDMVSSNVTLTPSNVPTGTGTDIFLLLVEFQQIVNGQQYRMADAGFKSLGIIEVL